MAPAFDPTPEIREPGYSHLSCCAPHSRDQEDLSSFKKPEESTIAPTTSIPSQVQVCLHKKSTILIMSDGIAWYTWLPQPGRCQR